MKNRKPRVTSPPLFFLSPFVIMVALFISGCGPGSGTQHPKEYMGYECTMKKIEGPFWTYRSIARSKRPMIALYRWDEVNQHRREFLFPRRDLDVCKKLYAP